MKILKVLWILGFAVAILAYPVAGVMGGDAIEVQMITPHAPDVVEVNQEMFSLEPPDVQSDPKKVIQLYGNATGEPVKVLFIDASKIVHPKEMKELVLLPVDKQKGEYPLQYPMVLFFAKMTVICSVIGSVILFGLWFALRARKKPAAPARA